jgi:putative ABC transport system substrate-binding protein
MTTSRGVQEAARVIGLQIQALTASTSREIDAAFATLAGECPDALFFAAERFFTSRRVQLATLAATKRDQFRQVGLYTGKILKAAKPADLPVVQSTKFEFVINLTTAKALGLTIPETLLATADEVIQ